MHCAITHYGFFDMANFFHPTCLRYLNHYVRLCNLNSDLFLLTFTYHHSPCGMTFKSPVIEKRKSENSTIRLTFTLWARQQDIGGTGRRGENSKMSSLEEVTTLYSSPDRGRDHMEVRKTAHSLGRGLKPETSSQAEFLPLIQLLVTLDHNSSLVVIPQ